MSLPSDPTRDNGFAPGDAWEPPADRLHNGAASDVPLPIVTAGEFLLRYPDLRPPLIDGLLRRGETMNIIAPPKLGKSWLVLDLALAVATGRRWLDRFTTTAGRVLIVDNELHPETIANRLRRMMDARGIAVERIANAVSILSLRGRLKDLPRLATGLQQLGHGRYALVILDAFYRTLPLDADENSNASMTQLYNLLDGLADALGASFAAIHHATKGSQSEKAVTDVGAGAGAQSRATDTHLVLRPHEETDAVVFDAVVRSWPPFAASCFRWTFPLWEPAPDLDPTALRRPRPRRRKPEGNEPPAPPKPEPWTAARFANAVGKPEPRARGAILEDARVLGLSDRMAADLLRRAEDSDLLHRWPDTTGRKRLLLATVPPPADPQPETPESKAPADRQPEAPDTKTRADRPRRQKKGRKAARTSRAHPPRTPPVCVNAPGGGVPGAGERKDGAG